MPVNGLDHVNIITHDLDGTASFYERLLGLTRGESPAARFGMKGAWMFDPVGNAIVHLSWKDPERDFAAEHEPGQPTAALHHVAFRCEGYDAMIENLRAMELEFRESGVREGMVRQIFLRDPNNINLELNFPGE